VNVDRYLDSDAVNHNKFSFQRVDFNFVFKMGFFNRVNLLKCVYVL